MVFIGIGAVTWLLLYAIPYIIQSERRPKKEEVAPKLTNFDRLQELLQIKDELTNMLNNIYKRGYDLKQYGGENKVCEEVLSAYKDNIDGYMGGAASLGRKYRRSGKILSSINPDELNDQIKKYTERVKAGEEGLEHTLKEKEATRERLQEIITNRKMIIKSLGEIEATLESLQFAITRAETEDSSREQVREDMQRTISTLGQSLDQTFSKLNDDEIFKKEKTAV
jgi:chromosome segregation ATPase